MQKKNADQSCVKKNPASTLRYEVTSYSMMEKKI
jgi:hypothetical protein